MNAGAGSDRSLNHLLLGMAVTFVLIIGVPALFSYLQWAGAPARKGWWILVATCFAMMVKLVASEAATGEFEFHKFGYDNCVTTLGAIIPALAIQLHSVDDEFPGLASASWLPTFGITDPARARVNQLVVFFAITWMVTLVTARICGGIKRGEVRERGLKALASALAGPFFLSLYALLLAAKKT